MKRTMIICAASLIVFVAGCSHYSAIEKADFTALEDREDFLDKNPNCVHREHIRNGEITRGMNAQEVMASWGMPNVYLVSRDKPEEYWIYYTGDDNKQSILIFTLVFDYDNNLCGWDIDMKRFDDHRVVSQSSVIEKELDRVNDTSKK